MKITSTKGTRHSKRSFNEANKISEILNDTNAKEKLLQESAMLEEQSKFERDAQYALNSSERLKRKSKMKAQKEYNESFDSLFNETFRDIVFNAIPLDEDVKESNKEYIHELIESVMSNFTKELTESKLPLVKECAELVGSIAHGKSVNKDVTYYENQLIENKSLISSVIQDKVIEVISEEKKIATLSLSESEVNTFFRKIYIENFKTALTESKEDDKEHVKLLAFSETVMDYTLCESLYTMGVFEIDILKFRKKLK